jgi:uncharacterized membrane protein
VIVVLFVVHSIYQNFYVFLVIQNINTPVPKQDKKEKASSAFAEPGRILPLIIFIALIIGCAYGLTKLVPILIALL